MSHSLLSIRDLDCGSVSGVNFELNPGQCLGLMGPSGAGKTRLLRAIADLDPHRGGIWLRGEARTQLPGHEWRRRVGYLPAESHWWAERVGDHMAAPPPESLAALGFGAEVLDWEIVRLSSGERQRLALLRLLAARPEVLLLDEPTANLDPVNAERVETMLVQQQRRGAGLVWVSHDQAQLQRLASEIFMVADGRLEPLA